MRHIFATFISNKYTRGVAITGFVSEYGEQPYPRGATWRTRNVSQRGIARGIAFRCALTRPAPSDILADAAKQLAEDIYVWLYSRRNVILQRLRQKFGTIDQRAFLAALSDANTGEGTWDPGWSTTDGAAGHPIEATNFGVKFWLAAENVRPAREGTRTLAYVRIEKELRALPPSFYFALGDHVGDSAARRLRVYWHLKPSAAMEYIREITQALNGEGIPFRTKVISNPAEYFRADAGVLYISEERLYRGAAYIATDPR
jgi:hypothetical protein